MHLNLSTPELIEWAIRRGEGTLAGEGSLVVRTGKRTGRSPKDKYVVQEPSSAERIWWGPVNQPFDPERFDLLYERMQRYLEGRQVFIQDCVAAAAPEHQVPIRVITEYAWHSLFARHLFLRPPADQADSFEPRFTIIDAPGFTADPAADGSNSEAFILLHFGRGLVLIGGTGYAGEMKKSVFTILHYILPQVGVFSMHCSANQGKGDDIALFFGLSGTGKTTLSADPNRRLIGDDEHGWSDEGIFNFEGGCYAKVIRLSPEEEPMIYGAMRFGTVIENVVIDAITRKIDFDSDAITENTRAAYPVEYIENALIPGIADHPRHVIFLTADAFAVLPPVARLTPEQAMYHFLSGYTAKVAGTEAGVGSEPQATFSTCFGAPFLPLPPSTYAKMLGEKLEAHRSRCWLINTGWIGGKFGEGRRIPLAYTRSIIQAVLEGLLDDVPAWTDPVFGFSIPEHCLDVPTEILHPRQQWRSPSAYDAQAKDLAARFTHNFGQFDSVPEAIRQAAPAIG